MRHVCLIMAAAAFVVFASGTARAVEETRASAMAADPYLRLADALTRNDNPEGTLQRAMEQTRAAMLTDPDMRVLERDYPGFVSEFVTALQPLLKRRAERDGASDHAKLREIFTQGLTAREAEQAADFYDSPLGRQLVGTSAASLSLTSSLNEAMKGDGTVSAQSYDRDFKQSMDGSRRTLSAEDDREIARRTAGQTWFRQLKLLMPRVRAVSMARLNQPISSEDEAEFAKIAERVLGRRMALSGRSDR